MRSKMGRPFEAGIHVTECDHRGETWKRRGSKKREFVDKVADGLLIGCSALVYGSRQVLLGNAQFLAKEVHFFLLRFEVGQVLVAQNEVEKNQPCTDKTKGVALAVAEVVLLHLAVDRSGKEMEQGSSTCLATNAGVPLLDKFFSKAGRAFPVAGARKGAELSQREVAGKHGNDVEKTPRTLCNPSLGFARCERREFSYVSKSPDRFSCLPPGLRLGQRAPLLHLRFGRPQGAGTTGPQNQGHAYCLANNTPILITSMGEVYVRLRRVVRRPGAITGGYSRKIFPPSGKRKKNALYIYRAPENGKRKFRG